MTKLGTSVFDLVLRLLQTACAVLVFGAAAAIPSPAQLLTTLYSFGAYPNDGAEPQATLVQGSDGSLYGTASAGGVGCNGQGCGTIFKITPSGTLSTLHSFEGPDGWSPLGGLIQASDGNFYGTTVYGGTNNGGTVFKITPGGTLTTLYSFCSQTNCADGYSPADGLVQASDGNLYGTTYFGGANGNCYLGCGVVFKITPGGTLTTLYSFCSEANCTDGDYPYGGLVQASDGNFYGTTSGIPYNDGTVFKITASGTLTTLHNFAGPDGEQPYAGLVQASDGNFYGTTFYGGTNSAGVVFKITPSGTLTTLHSFAGSDGELPYAGLMQASDGNFYGVAAAGGAYAHGTVFRLGSKVVRCLSLYCPNSN